jgi:hypothetical protein
MDYKAVLQEQIRELQKLQDKNINSGSCLETKIDKAIKIAEQIRKIYVDAKGPLD